MDIFLSELLSLKLGVEPYAEGSHEAVRLWLQEALDKNNDPKRSRVSQWLREQVVTSLLDTKLSNQYDKWILRH